LEFVHSEFHPCVVITVQPSCGLWEAFELPGIQPLFCSRQRAIEAAQRLLKRRSGLIEVHNSDGSIDEVIVNAPRLETAMAA
jgi:hypothetical protein